MIQNIATACQVEVGMLDGEFVGGCLEAITSAFESASV